MEERLVDEKLDQLHAADAADRAAHSAVLTAQQQVAAAEARVESARADLLVSKAKVRVAEASVGKAKVMVSYTQITSPYDGVITHRNFHRGAFIRSADQGGEMPLLIVDRTDLMRIVVQIPDREVPFTCSPVIRPRSASTPCRARRSRAASPASPKAKTDESRPCGSKSTCRIPTADSRRHVRPRGDRTGPAHGGVTIPSACFAGDIDDSKGASLCREQRPWHALQPVVIGADNGTLAEVVSGPHAQRPGGHAAAGSLADGVAVAAVAAHAVDAGSLLH